MDAINTYISPLPGLLAGAWMGCRFGALRTGLHLTA